LDGRHWALGHINFESNPSPGIKKRAATTFHTKKYDRGAGGITCPWFWLRFVNYAEKQTPNAKPYKLFATARQRESGRLPPVNDDTG